VDLFRSLGKFLLGILKRIYWLLPLLLSDPFDILDKWGIKVVLPSLLVWILTGLGFFIACFLTYHELRLQSNKYQKEIITQEWKYRRKLLIKQRESTNLKNIPTLLNKMRVQIQKIVEAASLKIKDIPRLDDIFSNMILYANRESQKWLSQAPKEKYNEQRLFLIEMTNAMEASDYGLSKLKQKDHNWQILEKTLIQYRPDYLIDNDLSLYIDDYLRYLDGFGNYMLYSFYHDKCVISDLEKNIGKEFMISVKRKGIGGRMGHEHVLNQLFNRINKRINELLRGDEAK
jgi:hypothetical protein